MNDRLLSIAETREALGGIGRTALWELGRSGQLVGMKIGRRVVYRESDIQKFIAGLESSR